MSNWQVRSYEERRRAVFVREAQEREAEEQASRWLAVAVALVAAFVFGGAR